MTQLLPHLPGGFQEPSQNPLLEPLCLIQEDLVDGEIISAESKAQYNEMTPDL